jgi:diadenylate cyclase
MLTAAAFPWDELRRLDVRAAVDILIIAIIIYYVLMLFRGTRAVQMTISVLFFVLFLYGARWLRLEMTEWLLTTLLPYFAIALLVLFHPEIRQAMARAGRNPFWLRFSSQDPGESYDDVLLAVRYFAQNKIGALIVLERETGLRTYVESGVALDAELSYDLLVSIFRPGSPLHDGAAIIQGSRVAAAACFLPLSLNPAISNQLGTRHRAAIGVTEESDAVAVVVSEQTGAVALAAGGGIELNLSDELLAQRLAEMFSRFHPGVALGARAGRSRSVPARE